ncbi:MAG: D-alanine--D-alanine ligase [Spirochaetia bacterium]|nr:D-alanine--D-alanine ligase [Spirochaetia bacterium]
MDSKRVVVFYGGRSGEHEISLISASSVVKGLLLGGFEVSGVWIDHDGAWFLQGPAVLRDQAEKGRLGPATLPCRLDQENGRTVLVSKSGSGEPSQIVDFAFPALHGTYGEDGRIQGLFEMLDLPYAGSGVTGSAVAMDKILTRQILATLGFPQVRFLSISSHQYKSDKTALLRQIERTLPFPLFVKPANLGSSVGVSKARNTDELTRALDDALTYDTRVIVEEGHKVRELETALLGNPGNVRVTPIGEILVNADFYSYEAKYLDPNASKLSIPAAVSPDVTAEIQRLAVTAFEALGCSGFARADFFLDQDSGRIYFNEINTIPGLTPASLFPLLWKEAGLSLAQVMAAIVEAGMERADERRRLRVRFPGAAGNA